MCRYTASSEGRAVARVKQVDFGFALVCMEHEWWGVPFCSGPSSSEAEDKVHFVEMGFQFPLLPERFAGQFWSLDFLRGCSGRSGCYHQCALARQASDLSHGLLCHADNTKYKQ